MQRKNGILLLFFADERMLGVFCSGERKPVSNIERPFFRRMMFAHAFPVVAALCLRLLPRPFVLVPCYSILLMVDVTRRSDQLQHVRHLRAVPWLLRNVRGSYQVSLKPYAIRGWMSLNSTFPHFSLVG